MEVTAEEAGFLLEAGGGDGGGLLEDPRIRQRLVGTGRLCQAKVELQFGNGGPRDGNPGTERLQAVL
jgi:hypothetical protein